MSNVAAEKTRSFVTALAVASLTIAVTGCGAVRSPGGHASAMALATASATGVQATSAAGTAGPTRAASATAVGAVETADSSPSATPAGAASLDASVAPDPLDGWLSQIDDLLVGAGQEIQQSDQAEQSGE